MSIGSSFDAGILRIRLKAAEDKVKAFESGEKYARMQEEFKAVFRQQNAKIRGLEEELGKAHAQTVNVRNIWSEIFDDIYREANAGKFALRKEIARLEQRVLEAERQRDAALDRLRDELRNKNLAEQSVFWNMPISKNLCQKTVSAFANRYGLSPYTSVRNHSTV